MKSAYPLWLLLFLSWSCTTPRVVTTIIPEAPEGHYAMGREYIPLENDQIGVELGFDGIQGEHLVFDFVVHNGTMDTLTIRPADFFYVILDSADAESLMDSRWNSVHPDTVLSHYDFTLQETEKAKGRNTFMAIMQASFDIMYNTSAFIATEDPGFIVDAVFRTAGTADQYISESKRISADMELIGEEREQVNEEIFRLNRLGPEQVGSGYVFFPLQREASFYMFCFPVMDQLFQFVYRQEQELVY